MVRKTKNTAEAVREDGAEKLKYGAMLDDTFQKIKEMMYNNELVPGQKIVYSDLAERLKTSTTPIRESLKLLETAKVVKYIPNKGYFVSPITEQEIRELYGVRESLEMLILPDIVSNITPVAIAGIIDRFRRLNTMDQRKQLILDKQFHMAVAGYSGNEVACNFLEQIMERIYMRYKPSYLSERRFKENLNEHRDILQALSSGDPKKARYAFRQHTRHQLDYILSYMLNK